MQIDALQDADAAHGVCALNIDITDYVNGIETAHVSNRKCTRTPRYGLHSWTDPLP